MFLQFISSILLNLNWKHTPLCPCCLFFFFFFFSLCSSKFADELLTYLYEAFLVYSMLCQRRSAASSANVFTEPGEQDNFPAWDLRILAHLILVRTAKTFSSTDISRWRFFCVTEEQQRHLHLRQGKRLQWLQMQSDAMDTSECIWKGRMIKEVMKITGNEIKGCIG